MAFASPAWMEDSEGRRKRVDPLEQGDGHALEGEWIGLEQADEMHHVIFGEVRVGFIDDRRPDFGLRRSARLESNGNGREPASGLRCYRCESAHVTHASGPDCYPWTRLHILFEVITIRRSE